MIKLPTWQIAVIAQSKADIVIPLHFFFSRKYASDEYSSNKPNRPYFPLCSAYTQKLTFELEFHKESFFSNTTQNLEISSFDIVTEEITVSAEERNLFIKGKTNFNHRSSQKTPLYHKCHW